VADYLLGVRDAERLPGEKIIDSLAPSDLQRALLNRWKTYLAESRRRHDPVFAPWHAFAALSQTEFAEKAATVVLKADPKKPINPLVARAFAEAPPTSLKEVARRY